MVEEKKVVKETKHYTDSEFRELIEEVCDHGAVHAMLYFDAQGQDEKQIQDALVSFMDSLNKEKGILFSKAMIDEVVEHEGVHTTFAECEIIVKDMPALNFIMLKYTPVGIQILHPTKEIRISQEQAHALLLTSGEYASALANLVIRNNLKEDQLHILEEQEKRRMDFARKLIDKSKKS
ncbi:Uncharacterised protein [uncultured archaeon]|nr:Uncharacterised protein [uncultured archaeon]